MRFHFTVAICMMVFLINPVHGQTSRLDSLLKFNEAHHREDSLKVELLMDIGREYRKLKMTEKRIIFIQKAIQLGEKIKVLSPIAPAYNIMGLRWEGLSEYEKSITNYRRAIEIAEQIGDKELQATFYLNYGTVYDYLGDYNQSLGLYTKAADLFLQLNKPGSLANCYVNIGNLHRNFTKEVVKGMEYLEKALAIFSPGDNGGDKRGMAESYFSMAGIYMEASPAALQSLRVNHPNQFTIARDFLLKAKEQSDKLDDTNLKALTYYHFGEWNEKMGIYDRALYNYQQSLQLHREDNDRQAVTNVLLSIGRVNNLQKNFTASLGFLHQALEMGKLMRTPELQRDALFQLSRVKENQRNFDSAYTYFQQFILMRDSVSNTEKQKEFTRNQLQFEFGIKEKEYQLGQQLADIRFRQQNELAIRQKQQLALISREKEIQQLNYLKKQAEMESDRKIQAALMRQKDLANQLETRISSQKISEQLQKARFNSNLSILMGIILLCLSGVAFFIYRNYQQTKQLNKLVYAQKESLEEMGKVKDKIFSIVSHDMRAPVNNLMALSSILEDGEVDQEKLTQYISQIKGTLSNTSSMMENLLNWAASQMQGFAPVNENVFLDDLVREVVASLEPEMHKKKLSLQLMIPEKLSFSTDRNMMELIVRNLLSNAIKFSKKGGNLEITAKQSDNDFHFSVKDSGIGIPEAKANLINTSKVVTMGSSYGTEKEKGTGLGLMLCKQFALMMNGSLSVETEIGKGSVFTLRIPTGDSIVA